MTPTGVSLLLASVAAALAAATSFLGAAPARPPLLAVIGRATAWAALALLLLNPGCARPGTTSRPLVLLDTSLSLSAAGGRLAEARALAGSLGEVRTFGDSRLHPPLAAAAASERPIVVVTDGEIRDLPAVRGPLLERTAIRVLPRAPEPDLAVTAVETRRRVLARDTITVVAEVRAVGDRDWGAAGVELRWGGRVLASRVFEPGTGRSERVELRVPAARLGPGHHLLEVAITGEDSGDPRTSRRLVALDVAALPGVVVIAASPDWESRFLFQTLTAVSALPTEGFTQVAPGDWRRMDGAGRVSPAVVAAAVRGADVVVSVGGQPPGVSASGATGLWEWPDAQPVAGDWYLSPVPGAPGVVALATVPAESLPPAVALAPLTAEPAGWTAFSAQLSRRGPERAAVVGTVSGGRRRVVVGASGFWRWAFRGGIAEQAYRSWVAETLHWLLAAEQADRPPVRLSSPVVPQDRPLVFEWHGAGPPERVTVRWTGSAGDGQDSLTFDGEGRATLRLPPGIYQVAVEGEPATPLAVEDFSDELLPGPVVVADRDAVLGAAPARRGVRESPWLFLVAAAAWCTEWWARRRAGLR